MQTVRLASDNYSTRVVEKTALNNTSSLGRRLGQGTACRLLSAVWSYSDTYRWLPRNRAISDMPDMA